ncbi:atherin-like [Nomascus leucogenys]|uniref:atherin-like n=1 Tax=Nomascus leucogenys TaxID=61853 RepID=UPI00122D8B0C|nr:atherin-like [Nomascus leucogenys]
MCILDLAHLACPSPAWRHRQEQKPGGQKRPQLCKSGARALWPLRSAEGTYFRPRGWGAGSVSSTGYRRTCPRSCSVPPPAGMPQNTCQRVSSPAPTRGGLRAAAAGEESSAGNSGPGDAPAPTPPTRARATKLARPRLDPAVRPRVPDSPPAQPGAAPSPQKRWVDFAVTSHPDGSRQPRRRASAQLLAPRVASPAFPKARRSLRSSGSLATLTYPSQYRRCLNRQPLDCACGPRRRRGGALKGPGRLYCTMGSSTLGALRAEKSSNRGDAPSAAGTGNPSLPSASP